VTGKARSPTVDSRIRRTISDDAEVERNCWLAEFVGEVRRCYTLPTLVNKESQLVVNPQYNDTVTVNCYMGQ